MHATIGQNITSHILFQRCSQSRDECVDQLYVTVCSRQATWKLRELHDLGAGRTRNFLSDAPIVKRLDNYRFNMLRPHLRDHFRKMRRRWRDSGLRFEEDVGIQTEAMRKVGPRVEIRDNVLAFER